MELKLTEEQIKLACDFILTAKFELDKKQIPVIFNAKIVTLPGVVGSFLEYNLIEQYLKKDFITIIIPVKRIDLDVALKNVVFQAKCFLKVLGVNYENMNTNENLETPVTDFDFSVRLLI